MRTKKSVGIGMTDEEVELVDALAKILSIHCRRIISRSEAANVSVKLAALLAGDLRAASDRSDASKASAIDVDVLLGLLDANVAQSVEQRFRKLLLQSDAHRALPTPSRKQRPPKRHSSRRVDVNEAQRDAIASARHKT